MTLNDFSWSAGGIESYVTGYLSSPAATIAGAAVFKYTSTVSTTTVYVYIPVSTSASKENADVIDLTSSSGPSASFSTFDGNGNLNSCFSFLNQNNFNQWYTQSSGTNVVLASRYIYKVSSAGNLQSSLSTPASTLNGIALDSTTAKATGDKLCYASASDVFCKLFSFVPASGPSSPSGSFGSASSSTGSSTSSRTQSPRAASIAKISLITSGPAGPFTPLSSSLRNSSLLSSLV